MSWLDTYIRDCEGSALGRQGKAVDLRARAADQEPARDFLGALHGAGTVNRSPAVIAEVKFKSPSQGVIRPAFDVETVAAGYARAGAACLSVLVDAPHFGGDASFLGRARKACGLPLLAKGFFVDPIEVPELRLAGADALLLIARCLARPRLEAMLEAAKAAGMAALVELHSDDDLARVEGLDLDLVGVNHRDLDSLAMDPDLSRRVMPRLPGGALKVAESGLETRHDLARMASLGYGAVLVGTAFMRQPDPGAALSAFLGQEPVHV